MNKCLVCNLAKKWLKNLGQFVLYLTIGIVVGTPIILIFTKIVEFVTSLLTEDQITLYFCIIPILGFMGLALILKIIEDIQIQKRNCENE